MCNLVCFPTTWLMDILGEKKVNRYIRDKRKRKSLGISCVLNILNYLIKVVKILKLYFAFKNLYSYLNVIFGEKNIVKGEQTMDIINVHGGLWS